MKKRAVRWLIVHMLAAILLVAGAMMFAEEILDVKYAIYAAMDDESAPEQDLSKFDDYPKMTLNEDAWYNTSRLIYHACGGIAGLTYTNSVEALEQTLQNTKGLVEADFRFTSDGTLVCVHKWSNIAPSDETMTLAEFEATRIFGKYTPMTAQTLISYMKENKNMHLVIDTKEDDCVGVVRELLRLCDGAEDVADRFVIQLYDRGYKAQMQALYPFEDDNFLFTGYKLGAERYAEIMEICYEEQIPVVTVQDDEWDAQTIGYFRDKGFLVFEHTINRMDYVEYATGKGVYGFYTDFLSESDLPMNQ